MKVFYSFFSKFFCSGKVKYHSMRPIELYPELLKKKSKEVLVLDTYVSVLMVEQICGSCYLARIFKDC